MASSYQENAKVFKALCDEKRLKILEILQGGEQCVCMLYEPLGLPVWHHKLLVWRALEPLAYDDAAPELLTRAVQESGRAIRRLADEQGPKIRIAWGRR